MVYIVGLLAVVFLVLTIVVLSRIATLAKGVDGNKRDNENPYEKRAAGTSNRINAVLMLAFPILGTIAAVWSFMESRPKFLPEAASEHGILTDNMFWISMAVITIAFVVTNALLFYFAYRYRYKPGRNAVFYPVNHKLEIIWTVIPAVVMAVLVFTGWRVWRDITAQAPDNSYVIEVVGKQFNWVTRYAGADDSKLGNYNFKLIDETNELGIDYADQAAFDDFTSNQLHIPKGVPVLLKIRAKDVLHSVFIPHLRVKMDAVPGMPTKFWFVATKTTEEMRNETGNPDFNYQLNCTEVCGQGHFSMKMPIVIEEEEEYKAWVASQKPFLTSNPTYLSRVPENLKARAMKYIESAASDSTSVATGGATATGTSLK
ncbi:MAG: cytochrome c oxidase subunit II [Cytophagaceae bacterium]|nr:cytochrome c oxidase subunit II [Cytophagaceae bacterium]